MLVDKGLFTFSIDSWVCGYTFLPTEDFHKGTGIVNLYLSMDICVGYRVVMLVTSQLDTTVGSHLQALVALYLEALFGQRL